MSATRRSTGVSTVAGGDTIPDAWRVNTRPSALASYKSKVVKPSHRATSTSCIATQALLRQHQQALCSNSMPTRCKRRSSLVGAA
jgi:hypothetical protein